MDEDQRFDDLLKAAFEDAASKGESVLAAIERTSGAKPRVLLRDPPEEESPVVTLGDRDADPGADDDRRYQVQGEIARGGIGVVYKGRDKDLGRSVALKVLRPEHAENAMVIHRFVEEAQIGGQLQHPGVVPVYGLGMQPDGRPYFAMKLVRGETLSALLEDRPDPSTDLRRFLAIFEQIADAMAYAHARGVIHRDLKPSNVMIGAFGEVQVVDWGLAKVLGQEEQPLPDVTVVNTVRSGSTGSASMVGSVLGTPAYMPPEQALGHVDQMDERSDVFALGAILLEILTGKPPYLGDSRDRLIQASQGNLEEAFERLEACAADDELKTLCRRCLASVPGKRPRNADVLARGMGDYLSAVEERARAAEVDAAEAKASAVEAKEAQAREHTRAAAERARRKRTLLAAAAILIAVLVGVGGFAWKLEADRDRERTAANLVDAARREASEARGAGDWAKALSAAKRAVTLADVNDADETTMSRAEKLLSEIETAHAEAREQARIAAEDEAILARFDEIRLSRMDHSDFAQAGKEYSEAFRNFGVDVLALDPEESAALLLARTRPVDFAIALDDWTWLRLQEEGTKKKEPVEALVAVANRIDPDPWRNRLRDAVQAEDVETLRELAETAPMDDLPPRTLALLGISLKIAGDPAEAIRFMADARRRHSDDLYLNHRLYIACNDVRPARHKEALRYTTAALALRPRSARLWHHHALISFNAKQYEVAEDCYRRSLALEPGRWRTAWLYSHLLFHADRLDEIAPVLRDALASCTDPFGVHALTGRLRRAEGHYEEALASYEEALQIDPTQTDVLFDAGWLLSDPLDRHEEGVAHFSTGLEYLPNAAHGYQNRGCALLRLGHFEEAKRDLERAVELEPDNPKHISNLAGAWQRLKRYDKAAELFKKAIRLDPEDGGFWRGLGYSLMQCDRYEEAIPPYRRSIELGHRQAESLVNVGQLEQGRGHYDQALADFRRALEIDPKQALAHARIGAILHGQKQQYALAEAHVRRAIDIEPGNAVFRHHLGNALAMQKKHEEAETEYRASLEFEPRRVHAWSWYALAQMFNGQGKIEEAVDALRRGIEADPKNVACRNNLAVLLGNRMGDFEGVESIMRELLAEDPGNPMHRRNLAWALTSTDRPEEARSIIEEILAEDPADAIAHNSLAAIRETLGDRDGALLSAKRSVALDPANAVARCEVARIHHVRGEDAEALSVLEEVERIDPEQYFLFWVRAWIRANTPDPSLRDPAAAVRYARRAVEIEPMKPESRVVLALALLRAGEDEAAMVQVDRALELDPESGDQKALVKALLLARAWKHDEARAWLETAGEWQNREARVHPDTQSLRRELLQLLDGKGGER